MHQPSATALRVPGSGIREIVELARYRDDVAHLEIGEPDFPTPAHVVEAAHRAALAGSGYTPSPGTAELRSAVRARLLRSYGHDVPESRIVISQGAVQGLAAIMAAVVEPGDEVLVPDPAWPNYEMQALLHGATVVPYALDPARGFQPDVAEIAALMTERTKVLVVNSPANPTGIAFPSGVVDELVDLARSKGVLLVSDEVYDEILFDGLPPAAFTRAPDDVVSVFSLSKTYAMTGWRIGYVVAPAWLAPTLSRLQEPLLSSISSVTQAAGVAALTGPQDVVATMREAYRGRRDLVVQMLQDSAIRCSVPDGAFYLMFPLATGVDARLAALDLVTHGVATAPGSAFGSVAGSHLRLSLSSSEDVLRTGVGRLLDWYAATEGGAALRTAAAR